MVDSYERERTRKENYLLGFREGYLLAKTDAVDKVVSSNLCDLNRALEVIGISLDTYKYYKTKDIDINNF